MTDDTVMRKTHVPKAQNLRTIYILELEWMSQRRFLGRISLPESQIDS